MKKVITIILVVISFIIVISLGLYYLLKHEEKIESVEGVGIHYVGSQWYTRNETKWVQMHPENNISYIENYTDPNYSNKIEFLTLDITKKKYLRVELPGRYQYMSTGNTIMSENGEILISVHNGIIGYDISLSKPILHSKTIKYEADGSKIIHTIVRNMNNYTIVAQVGSNSEDWSIIRDMVMRIEEDAEINVGSINTVMHLPEVNKDITQSVFLSNEYMTEPTRFLDGYISISNSAYNFQQNKDIALTWISTVSDRTNISKYNKEDEEIFYAESDNNFFVSVFRNNNQFMYIIYGFGDEAKTNLLHMIEEVK